METEQRRNLEAHNFQCKGRVQRNNLKFYEAQSETNIEPRGTGETMITPFPKNSIFFYSVNVKI